ncbi:MAG TPA: ribosome-associated translation inhibitor RaiA [Candidatus Hydrogenedens sp.]|nr:ribosome-associated translation inhibitor RaiA [Candidatus Hydrogenedens sp.]HOK08250.1 ribosome-associated translation inhibitor RaiA [Candidatus Hydrogenedens sp.]HOL19994.1 ribosome-associated translation inhibitor RaiA [Candidatus Hydrogenedens sp.]HPP59159.1 ribosome-associated translation inhibitor RaiA [Candidatus Hydrogenedens sp.]
MNVHITCKHMESSEALKSYTENALKKLEHYFDKIIEANVIMDVEKHRHICEINLNANGVRIHSKESSPDMYASVDAVIEKLERQIRKFKEKIKNHKPRNINETRKYKHVILELKEETPQKEETEEEPVIPHEIVHREHITLKPMTVDEALMQIQLLEEPFLVFINVDTSQVNVLYPRGNSTYGLIEPQF